MWMRVDTLTTIDGVSGLSLMYLLFILLLQTPPCTPKKENFRQMEKKILDSIIGAGRYDSRIRPSGVANGTEDGDGPALVRVNVYVRSISRIDDVTMEYSCQITFREQWRDDRLVYDDLNGAIRYLTLTDPDKIWKPDLFFSNEKEGHFHDIIMPNVLLRIHPDGAVLYSIRISLVLACPMDLKYYPLDKQTCSIKMASYGYTTEDVVLIWKEQGPVQVTKNLHLPRFTLTNFKTDYCTSRTNTGEYSCIIVHLIFKREFSYYLIQIYIPCIMLVIVSWVSFWLDPNAIPARVSLGVTTLLTMATQISGINASLPPVSYTKAIDVWTGVCLTFVFGALLEFALVNYASRSDAHRAASKKKQDQQQQQEMSHQMMGGNMGGPAGGLMGSINSQHPNLPWDLEAGFDFENLENGPASYITKPVMRGGRGSGALQSFVPFGPGSGGARSAMLGPRVQLPPAGMAGGPAGMLAPPVNGANGGGNTGSAGGQGVNSGSNAIGSSGVAGILSSKMMSGGGHEIRATPASNKNFCQRWLQSFPTRSKRIDVISRIFFPLMFGLFNIVYWTTYTFREDLNDS